MRRKGGRAALGIVAVDGEGETLEGRHSYVYLADSDGRRVEVERGGRLGTLACLTFLDSLPADRLAVCYGISYDVTHWLRELSRRDLVRLWTGQRVRWGAWELQYPPPHRAFTLTRKAGPKRSITVYDLWAWEQGTFVEALERWDVGTPQERGLIAAGKARRPSRGTLPRAQLRAYCSLELRLLRELGERLTAAVLSLGVTVRSWHGPGVLAAGLLDRHGVGEHRGQPPAAVQGRAELDPHALALRAYFGGRVEAAVAGVWPRAWLYDLHSAYPAALVGLPCLDGAAWEWRRDYDPGAEWALWRCSWSVPDSTRWPPLPVRAGERIVYWPLAGSGWYWAPEVRAALATFGGAVTVHEGVQVVPRCQVCPFGWVADVYAERERLRRAGSPAERPLKLALAAVWGKLCQSAGRFGGPAWQDYATAGLATAITRSRLLAETARDPGAVLAVGTDALLCSAPLDVATGDGLGQWGASEVADLWLIAAGWYEGFSDVGRALARTRGSPRSELDWSEVRRAWEHDPLGEYAYRAERHVGIGTAAGDWRSWGGRLGEWVQVERSVSFWPSRRWPDPSEARDGPPIRFYPPATAGCASRAFAPLVDAVARQRVRDAEQIQDGELP